MIVALCILAKDEAGIIGKLLDQLLNRTLLSNPAHQIGVQIVANGCSDDTAQRARTFSDRLNARGVELHVREIFPGGKSRAWNRAVHEFINGRSDVILFMDADIRFVDDRILAELIERLEVSPSLAAAAGYPIKDIALRGGASLIDRLSLKISNDTRSVDAISGQLYAARGEILRDIWLPDETPGEDGFLNAMINTYGSTRPHQPGRVVGHFRPTHYYEALGPATFVKHERRLIVGTALNIWIFEHLMALRLTQPAGQLINLWNETNPSWVDQIAATRTAGRKWVLPPDILGRRLRLGDRRRWSDLKSLPLALVATAVTLVPAILANWRLRRTGAASIW